MSYFVLMCYGHSISSTSLTFTLPTNTTLLGNDTWGQKRIMMGVPGRERSLTISLAIWIQYTNVSDGRTPADNKDRAPLITHSVLSVAR